MQPVLHNDELYSTTREACENSAAALRRLEEFAQRLQASGELLKTHNPPGERSLWTQTVDRALQWVRNHLPFVHRIGAVSFALALYIYARLVGFTARLVTAGRRNFPDLPAPGVIALWHSCAPSLLVAIAMRQLKTPTAIMIARDPRGDSLTLLCNWLGLEIVRGDSSEHGWEALGQLAQVIGRGGQVLLTADGGGPARIAKVGAIALASATRVPLIPLGADCLPAIFERHKWDAARNPLPFGRIAVAIGESITLSRLANEEAIEEARLSLQTKLNHISETAHRVLE